MNSLGFAVIAAALILYGVVSRRLETSPVTGPMVFVALGLAIGSAGLGLADLEFDHGVVHTLAELTLVLVLFSDAARIDLGAVRRYHDLPVRMLAIGMPLTIVLGVLAALALPLGLGLWEAAVLAAILAPTDAALGQSVVTNREVPPRIRQALNVESGLNDGIALPAVLLFASFASMSAVGNDGNWLAFAAMQVTLGPLAGAAVAFAVAWLIARATAAGWMAHSYQGPAVLGTAVLAYAGAVLIGGNGFIAAFVAGMVFGNRVRGHKRFLLRFAEAESHLATMLVFLIFGASILPEAAGEMNLAVVAYAALSLTVVRMVPVALSLIGMGARPVTVAFLGWFGPRGLASILFVLFVLEEANLPGAATVFATVVATAALSILLHGITAAPFARRYGRTIREMGDGATEMRDVGEMQVRSGHGEVAE